MNKYQLDTLERVQKKTAAAVYNAGFDVMFIPCKCNPENEFYNLGVVLNKNGSNNSFEKTVDHFEYYNCQHNELGKYTAFYVKREPAVIHIEFENGSNPYIYRGSVVECTSELKRWEKQYRIQCAKPGFYTAVEKSLYEIYNNLMNGKVYGYDVNDVTYPYFSIVLYKDLGYFSYSHFGSSAVKATIDHLEWLITTIFRMTPDEFVKTYDAKEVK